MNRWHTLCIIIFISFYSWCGQKLDIFAHLQQSLGWPLRPHYSFFSPGDNIKALLLGFIGQETRFVRAALYRLTDADIADELIKARQRGVKVELVVDGSGVHDGYSKVEKLRRAGIKIYVHPANAFRIMHLKMMIFGSSIYGRPYVWTGSANPTGGLTRNAEHVLVLTDGLSITRCDQEFRRLKESCEKVNS